MYERNGGGDLLPSAYTNEVTAKDDGTPYGLERTRPAGDAEVERTDRLVLFSVLLLWQTGAGRKDGLILQTGGS